MRTFFILLTKELRGFFVSPVAYIVLGLVMALNGIAFNASVSFLMNGPPSSGSLVTWTFQGPWFYLCYFAIFPLITMRLFAEEQRLGTLETMLTAPVRASQLVLAKFAAATLFYAILWVPSLANFYIFQWVTAGAAEIPGGALAGSYIIVMAMGVFNIALGCFASSLTSSQLVAAILCFTMSVLHFLVGLFATTAKTEIPEALKNLIRYFSSSEHIQTFSSGLIDTRPLVYYITLAIVFLTLTHQVLEYRRWKV
ncbi:hypothetical protein BH23VER1_BH23VER1_08190 [soil metagenome]